MNAWNRSLVALQRRRPLALGAAALLLAASAAAVPGLPFGTGLAEHLPTELEPVGFWLDASSRFGAFESLIVGLEEPRAPFTAEGLRRLQRVTGGLEGLKSEGVVWVRGLANVESVREGADGSVVNELLLSEVPDSPEALAALSRRVAADAQVSGAFVSRDQRAYAVMLRLDPKADAAAAARAIRGIVEAERGPLAAWYFGAPFFTGAVAAKVRARLPWMAPAMALLLVGILALGLRRRRVVALVVGGALAAVLLWLGLLRLSGFGLTQGTASVGLLVFALAAVGFARDLETWFGPEAGRGPSPLSAATAAVLVGGALAALAIASLLPGLLAGIGRALALGCLAVLATGMLFFAPIAAGLRFELEAGEEPEAGRWPRRWGWALAAGAVVFGLLPASQLRLRTTPQAMFSPADPVGRSLAFFERRFGGSDYLQVHVRGDLHDPAVAARVQRFADLLEGSGSFSDVRAVTQVLGFLNRGFGGIHRVPPARESLGSLWFFLEGSADVHSLVGAGRDEAMVMARVPSRASAGLEAAVAEAVAGSAAIDAGSAAARLAALARSLEVELAPERIAAIVGEAAGPQGRDERVERAARDGLHAWLASPDSPYPPTEEEWARLEPLLARGAAARPELVAAAGAFPDFDQALAAQLVDTLLARQRDLRLTRRSRMLAEKLAGETVPERFLARAQGVFADLLDPPAGDEGRTVFRASGLPLVTPLVEARGLRSLWIALGLLLAIAALVTLVHERRPGRALSRLLGGAAATAAALAAGAMLGLDADPVSLALYLAPALLLPMARGQGRGGQWGLFALAALAACGGVLAGAGVLPVVRLGLVWAIGLVAAGAAASVAALFATPRVDG